MIKAVIVDDHPHAIEALKSDIEYCCFDVEIIGSASNAAEGYKLIQQLSPDLVFLDVEMPGKTGFDLLEHFPSPDFEIIFVTAYDDFALKAIKTEAIDYLLKPVDTEELKNALGKYRKKRELVNASKESKKELPSGDSIKLAIPINGSILFVDTKDVYYCQAEGSYTNVVTVEKSHIISRNLKETETHLPDFFIRTHNSYAVNLNHVIKYTRGEGGYVTLTNGTSIPVAKNRKEEVIKALNIT